MKIIQERKPFEDWTMTVTCDGNKWNQEDKVPCGSTLEMDSNDLIKRDWFKYPDSQGLNYGFICPVCGCFSEIDKEKLPKYLEKLAKDYFAVIKEMENSNDDTSKEQ